MTEWHGLTPIYQRLAGYHGCEAWLKPQQAETASNAPDDQDALLNILMLLEINLREDLARKLKHQKPQLQARWRDEIAELTARLSLG